MRISLKSSFAVTGSLFLVGLIATMMVLMTNDTYFDLLFFSVLAVTFFLSVITVLLVFAGMGRFKRKYVQQVEELSSENLYLQGLVDTLSGQGVADQQDEKRDNIKRKVNSIRARLSGIDSRQEVLSEWCKAFRADVGVLFLTDSQSGRKKLRFETGYAFYQDTEAVPEVMFGVGLTGKVAAENRVLNITNVPKGHIQLVSGLGETTPKGLIIVPISNGEEVVAVIEMARLTPFDEIEEQICQDSAGELANKMVA